MALSVPAIAWIEQSALLLLLGAGVVLAIGVALWWSGGDRAEHSRSTSGGSYDQ
jgi:hypothetical protein